MKINIPPSVTSVAKQSPFVPQKHLQLEAPKQVWTLRDFGYSDADAAQADFDLAVTSPFRILSDEGVSVLRDQIEQLKSLQRSSDRIAKFLRGSLYASQFIRDLCHNPEVNDFVSQIVGRRVLPHPMPLYQGHINLMPDEPARDVDKWHTDTVVLDYVLMVTDPQAFKGGHFEYLKCTKAQAIRALIREEWEPSIVKVEFPRAGYALLQQGHLVMHRASEVSAGVERTTLVQSFIPDHPNFLDVSKLDDCKLVDPHELLFTEWSRYKAYLTKRRLEEFIDQVEFTDDKNKLCMQLRRAIRDVEEAILEISDPSEGRLIHYGQDALTDPL